MNTASLLTHARSNRTVWSFLAILSALASASALFLGFGKLAELDLDESRLLTATIEVVLLGAVFAGLAVACHLARSTRPA